MSDILKDKFDKERSMSEDYMQEMDENLGIIALICDEVDGQDFWAYVDVFPSKYMELLEVRKAGEPYTLTEFGNILKYGVGTHEPPAEVVQEMKDEYGADPKFQENLKHDVERQISQMRNKP